MLRLTIFNPKGKKVNKMVMQDMPPINYQFVLIRLDGIERFGKI